MESDLPGIQLRTLVSGEETGGAVVVFRERSDPGVGPPLHVHDAQTEVFHVVEGRYRFRVDGETFELEAGGCAVAPMGSAHAFKNIGGETGELRVEMIPALESEAFFAELPRVSAEDAPAFFAKHRNRLIGPSGL